MERFFVCKFFQLSELKKSRQRHETVRPRRERENCVRPSGEDYSQEVDINLNQPTMASERVAAHLHKSKTIIAK